MPFAQLLSLEGAVRHADYSHAGQATSWKAGAIWEPTDGLRLRATISRAIRAPNIFEAFRPSEGQTTNVEDPCAETNLGDNPKDRKSVVSGKSVSVRVDLGGRRIIQNTKEQHDRNKNKAQQ